MVRLYYCGVGLLVVLGSSASAVAQDWPTYPLDGHSIDRGPGNYFSWVKLLLLWILYLVWVKTTDWVNQDTQEMKLNGGLWTPLNFFPFVVALLAIALSFAFPVGYTVALLAWVAPLGAYIYQRNANVEEHERVLTPGHLRFLMAQLGNKMGLKIDAEKKAAYEKGAPVLFTATSGESDSKNQANMILARQSTGYVAAKDLIADAIDRRGQKMMLDVEADQIIVRYQVDGVWHESDPLEREAGDPILEVYKLLSDSDPEEVRKRQAGTFTIQYNDDRHKAELVSQGTKTGERTIINFVQSGLPFDTITEAGMREKMEAKLRELFTSPKGIILFCAVPGGGLSTTMALAQKLSDRYMRDFIAFQSAANPEPVADNIDIQTYAPDSPSIKDDLVTIFRKDPDVVIIPDLVNKEVAEEVLARVSAEDKLVVTSVRAKEAVEGLLRILLLKVPAKTFAPLAICVVNQRLVRKLCEECKEEYTPTPELLKKLGIPQGRVDVLYKTPEVEEGAPTCKACGGIGFFGRTSIFELVVVDDRIRKVLVESPKLEVLRQAARKGGNRTLQQEGIALVAQGVTSLQELQRVLNLK